MNAPVGGGTPQLARNQKTLAIVIAVVVVIVLVGIAGTVIVLTRSHGPTATVRDYMGSYETGDRGRAYNATIWRLNQSLYSDWVNRTNIGEVHYQFDFNSLTEIPKKEMTAQEKHVMNETAQNIEKALGVVVRDYCIVRFNVTVTWTEQEVLRTDDTEGQFPLVKIDGSWLIVVQLDYLEDLVGYHPPFTPVATLVRMTITNGVKIVITSITQTDVPWDDIGIELSAPMSSVGWFPTDDLATGSTVTSNYTDSQLGSIDVCCLITDLTGNGFVNSGDYFTLFTFGGAPTFSATVTYSLDLVYEPNGDHIASMTFNGPQTP